jgi:CheY-like chemotaxis protein
LFSESEALVSGLLIVDDEHDVREFAVHFFRKRNVSVSVASCGAEALQRVEQDKPQMVLLDISMDDMDGREVLRCIKQLDPAIKVIMVTGKKPEEESALDTCRMLGACAYIHKPLQLDDLEKVVLKELVGDTTPSCTK